MFNLTLNRINFNTQNCYLFIVAIGLLFAALFMTSCGGGDTDEEGSSPTSIVQPPSTTPTETLRPVEEVAVAEPEVAEEVGISFQNDILPILEKNCALAGCHVAGGAAGLDGHLGAPPAQLLGDGQAQPLGRSGDYGIQALQVRSSSIDHGSPSRRKLEGV